MDKQIKYRAGDLVTIALDIHDANRLNKDCAVEFHSEQITAHTPAPFDWADVKPGMAFGSKHPTADGLVWYIGPHLTSEERVIITTRLEFMGHDNGLYTVKKRDLVRVPVHDIEVQE